MNELKINTVEYSTKLLKDSFPKGSTVYLVIRQVSRSGMYRHISVHGIKDNKVSYYSYHSHLILLVASCFIFAIAHACKFLFDFSSVQ